MAANVFVSFFLCCIFCFLLFHIALNLTLESLFFSTRGFIMEHQHEALFSLYSRLHINLELEAAGGSRDVTIAL